MSLPGVLISLTLGNLPDILHTSIMHDSVVEEAVHHAP